MKLGIIVEVEVFEFNCQLPISSITIKCSIKDSVITENNKEKQIAQAMIPFYIDKYHKILAFSRA